MQINLFNAVDFALKRKPTKNNPIYFKEWREISGYHYYRIYREENGDVNFEHYLNDGEWKPVKLMASIVEECENPFMKRYSGRGVLQALLDGETLMNESSRFRYKLKGDFLYFRGGGEQDWNKSSACGGCLVNDELIRVEENF